MSRGASSSRAVVVNGPCGACKFLRRKCVEGCVFAPYFDANQGATYFASVHKIFGASNVSKLLLSIPVQKRADAVATICYEAQARTRDPVYGCVSQINNLQQQLHTRDQQVAYLQAKISYLQGHAAKMEELARQQPAQQQQAAQQQPSDLLPSAPPIVSATFPVTFDASLLFDPSVVSNPSWVVNQQQQQRRAQRQQQQNGRITFTGALAPGGGENQPALGKDLLGGRGHDGQS